MKRQDSISNVPASDIFVIFEGRMAPCLKDSCGHPGIFDENRKTTRVPPKVCIDAKLGVSLSNLGVLHQ